MTYSTDEQRGRSGWIGVRIQKLFLSQPLGGTLTMVASGPLIVLNDLLMDGGHEAFNLFSVTPIGLTLLLTGLALFYFFGGLILPKGSKEEEAEKKKDLQKLYNLPRELREVAIPKKSSIAGKNFKVKPVAYIHQQGEKTSLLNKPMEAGMEMIVFGRWEDLQRMKSSMDFVVMSEIQVPDVLPTHPVNAFTMGPGGYRNKDYLKAGGLMSVAFLVVVVTMIYFFY